MAVGDKIKKKENTKLSQHLPFYNKIDDFTCPSYESIIKQDYIQPYLTELTNESRAAGVYVNRLKRSYPLTITESILHQHHAPLDQQITISGFGSEDGEKRTVQDEIIKNVDGEGTTAQQAFSNQIYEHLSKGFHAVVVEKDGSSPNLAEAKQKGERSYQKLYEAERIKDVQRFESGPRKGQLRLVELLLSEYEKDDKRHTKQDGKRKVQRRVVYSFLSTTDGGYEDKYTMQVIENANQITQLQGAGKEEVTWEVVQEVKGSLDRLPVVIFGTGPKDSESRRTVDLDVAIINRISIWSNINYNQGFQRSAGFGISQSERETNIGENQMNWFSDPSGHIDTIEPGDPKSVFDEIKFLISHGIRYGLYRTDSLNPESKEAPSFDSKVQDEVNRLAVYESILNYFEPRMSAIYELHALFDGGHSDMIEVNIARDFKLESEEVKMLKRESRRNKAREHGEVGQIILNQDFAQEIMEMDLIVPNPEDGQKAQDVEEYRSELIQKALTYSPPQAQILPFRPQAPTLEALLPPDEDELDDNAQAA